MKNLLLIVGLSVLIISCREDNQNDKISISKNTQNEMAKIGQQQEGKKLFKQYCMACHFIKPDPSKKNKMLAPPIIRVVQHYKGTYSDKKNFVNAVVNWANKPNNDAVLMPGAARKFGLMPPMPIGNNRLEKIAGYLFDANFEKFGNFEHKSHRKSNFKQIEKQTLDAKDINQLYQAVSLLQNSHLQSPSEYRQMGKKVFNIAKNILLNKNYEGKTLQQIQMFFHQIEEDMHRLMSVKNNNEGEKYRKIVLKKMSKFDDYFSSKR